MKKKDNRVTFLYNEIESPIEPNFADWLVNLAIIASFAAIAVLVFDFIGGADFLLWVASKI